MKWFAEILNKLFTMITGFQRTPYIKESLHDIKTPLKEARVKKKLTKFTAKDLIEFETLDCFLDWQGDIIYHGDKQTVSKAIRIDLKQLLTRQQAKSLQRQLKASKAAYFIVAGLE